MGPGCQGCRLSYAGHELLQHLLGLTIGHNLSILKPDQPVCQIPVDLRQVRDHHDGQVQFPSHILDGVQHLLLGGRAGHGGRLIQQQNLWLFGELPRNDQPLFLPAAQDGGQMIGLFLQPHQAQVVHGLIIHLVIIGIFGNGKHLIASFAGVDPPHHIHEGALRP